MYLNKYRIMWVFVFFDLPTGTKRERKAASRFREDLKKDGFIMMQFSVYVRNCPNRENAELHVKRVKSFLPPKGMVNIMKVTDAQYSLMESFIGKKASEKPEESYQLEFF